MYGRHGMDETGWKWSTADQDADHNALFKKKKRNKKQNTRGHEKWTNVLALG